MYTRSEYRGVEPKCYETEHVEKIVEKIRQNFSAYFERFIETEAGTGITMRDFQALQEKFGVKGVKDNRKKDMSSKFKRIIADSIEEFEKDRQSYLDIFDPELLEEYEEDSATFKSEILRNKCPIIRKTIANKKAKELDKYRYEFGVADADYLLSVVTRLYSVADDYTSDFYNKESYENIDSYQGLNMAEFDSDECTAYGVIGGGIKTLMLNKLNPEVFSSRSRSALWALWYLTDKECFGCQTDSEFLMIDINKCITQQNYFYPYELFAYYAFEIYKMLKDKATELDAYIDPSYRYVIVDAFFEFVASEHENEIGLLQSQIRDFVGDAYA